MYRLSILFIGLLFFATPYVKAQQSQSNFYTNFNDSLQYGHSEKGVLLMVNEHSYERGQEQRDSLYRLIEKKYPNGRVAAYLYLLDVVLEKTTPENSMNLNRFLDLKHRYPGVDMEDPSTSIGKMYNQIRYMYFGSFINEDSVRTMKEIYANLKSSNELNSIAWSLYLSKDHLSLAESIGKQAVVNGATVLADSTKIPKANLSSWKNGAFMSYSYALDTYAQILAYLGKHEDALKYENLAIKYLNENNPDFNNTYLNILLSNKDYNQAKTFGEKVYSEGNGDANTKLLLDSLYRIQNPGESSNNYIKDLENKSFEGRLLNIDAPDFALKDLDGKDVRFGDLKGKIVILDFWATWCGPCIASFPGMQLAINKYKNNKDVVFLFVDTFESMNDSIARHNAVAKVISSMGLDFRVLLDQREKNNSSKYALAGKLGFTSIPTKFIVGKDGKIKFKLVGFAGSAEAVLKEMDDYLGYLLKQ